MVRFRENSEFKFYLSDRLVKINLFFCFSINAVIWLILTSQIKNLTDSVILHYNVYFGIDLLGSWYQLFWLPAIGVAIIFTNFLFASLFLHKERILSYFLVFGSSLAQVIILLASLSIIFING